jgi:acyl-CoA hydrolase
MRKVERTLTEHHVFLAEQKKKRQKKVGEIENKQETEVEIERKRGNKRERGRENKQ